MSPNPEIEKPFVKAKDGIFKIKPHMVSATEDGLPPVAIALDSNESAFGPSPHAREAARAAAVGLERYLEAPDRLLAPAIADRSGIDASRITVGQGSDDLLARLGRAYLGPGTELIRSANGYLKVPNYAYANDAEVISVPDQDFVPSVDAMLAAVSPRTRMVYLANPENPAGTCLGADEIRRLHGELPNNVLLVIDCAYEEYIDTPAAGATHRLVEEADNVVMCRTFSKIFGLAGARVGWIYAPHDVLDPVRRIGLTFPLSAPAVAPAIGALGDRAHTQRVFTENRRLRDWMTEALTGLGLRVTPSQANFVLVTFPDPAFPASEAAAALRRQGIAVRRFASPAYADCVRITLGFEHELRTALGAIAVYLRRNAA